MILYNLRIAFRHLWRHRYTTSINLAGLIVGMTAALLIWQYVSFEKSYDDFHEHGDRIFRVQTDRYDQGQLSTQWAAGAAGAGPILKENFPEIETFVKIYTPGDRVIKYGDAAFRESKVVFAGDAFFTMFSYRLIRGDKNTCLSEPLTACLSESTARKYFGDSDPLGKTLSYDGRREYKVTGVFEDMPENSHLGYDILLSYVTLPKISWPNGNSESTIDWDGFLTYLLLREGTDAVALEAKFPALIEHKFGAMMRERDSGMIWILQPLRDIYLNSHYMAEAKPNGDSNAVRFLSIIGGLVLIIAWFNYINLSTARSDLRAREVGVRKVVGSSRASLLRQFLTEAGVLTVGAVAVSLGLTSLLAPSFSQLVGKTIPLTLFSEPKLWIVLVAVFLAGSVLAALYPAVVHSSMKPLTMLKGVTSSSGGQRGGWLRKSLVVVQFAASVALIVSTLVVFRQISHMRDAKLGVDVERTVVMNAPRVVDSTYHDRFETFRQELLRIHAVQNITGSTAVPGSPVNWNAGGIRRWGASETEGEQVRSLAVDFDFIDAYGLDLVAGRGFEKGMHTDSTACIFNERAIQQLRFDSPEQAVGVDIDYWGDRLTIVGVVKNYHHESPKEAFEPLVIRVLNPEWPPQYYSMKLNTERLPQTMASVEALWKDVFPGNPFDYFFLDQHFAMQYAADRRFGLVFGLFAALAIFVSCLGLFALAAHVAERRTKEIGVRKVLGASVQNLVGLMTKDFMWLVLAGILVASPIAWWFMNKWLTGFSDRIAIDIEIFGVAGILAIMIAFTTISYQSIKTALVNPVASLRSE